MVEIICLKWIMIEGTASGAKGARRVSRAHVLGANDSAYWSGRNVGIYISHMCKGMSAEEKKTAGIPSG